MRHACLPFAVLAVCVATATATDFAMKSATVYGTPGNVKIEYKLDCDAPGSLACGTFVEAYNSSGWARLHLNGTASASPADAAYGVGYLEGALSQHSIYMAFTNMWHQFFGATPNPPTKLVDFVEQNWAWVQEQAEEAAADSPYWAAVQTVSQQQAGLMAGYLAVAPASELLTSFQFLCLQLDGDMETLTQIFGTGEGTSMPDVAAAPASSPGKPDPAPAGRSGSLRGVAPQVTPEGPAPLLRFGHCSVCIRATKDNLYMGHDTWDGFEAMLRTFKHYKLAVPSPTGETKQTIVSLSSTPGYLSSVDDFYLTDRGLYVTETTNGIYNNSLLTEVVPKGVVFSWMRCMVATYTADTGEDWAKTFGMYNSGTYNNQWMIVTLNKFDNGTLNDGLLWVTEQIPKLMVGADQTDALRTEGYWGSYNVPFYPEVYKRSGFEQQFKLHGNAFSHEHCPRANIMRRDAPNVETFKEYQLLMQYNDWQHDPLQLGSAANGIMSRYDLLATGADAFGGIDSKTMDVTMARNMQVAAMNGPTHVTQPPFEWDARWDAHWHLGQAPRFDFSYDPMSPWDPADRASE